LRGGFTAWGFIGVGEGRRIRCDGGGGGAKPRDELCVVRSPGAYFCIVVLRHSSLLVAVYYLFAKGGLRWMCYGIQCIN